MKNFLTLIFAALIFFPAVSSAQYLDVKSLKEIDSVSVWIELPPPDSAGLAFADASLKGDLEKRLSTAGFTVVEDAPQNLYLSVNIVNSPESGNFACIVKLEFLQGAWLERMNEWNFCSTWFREFLGMYPATTMSNEIRSTVSDLMDQFVRDALSVNPKPPAK